LAACTLLNASASTFCPLTTAGSTVAGLRALAVAAAVAGAALGAGAAAGAAATGLSSGGAVRGVNFFGALPAPAGLFAVAGFFWTLMPFSY